MTRRSAALHGRLSHLLSAMLMRGVGELAVSVSHVFIATALLLPGYCLKIGVCMELCLKNGTALERFIKAMQLKWDGGGWDGGGRVGKHLWVGSLRPWPIVFVSDSVWGGYLIILLTFVQGRLWNSPLDPCLEKVLVRPARAWLASQDWQSEAAQLNPCGAESRQCLMRLSGVRSPPLVTTSSLRVLYNSLLPNSPRSYLLYPPNFIFPFEGPKSKSI